MILEIISSAFNPLFFRQAVRRSAGRAFLYYLLFTTLYTIALCGIGFWWASGHWENAVEKLKVSAPDYEVALVHGRLSTTFPEPYIYSSPEFTVILDTRHPLSIESVPDSPRALLLSATKVTVKKNEHQFLEYAWNEIPDFRLKTAGVIDALGAHKQTLLWSAFVALAFGILPVIFFFFIPVIFVIALFLWIAAKLLQRRLTYAQTLTIAFYAITLPVLAQTALTIFAWPWAAPRMFWVIYLLWALIGVWFTSDAEETPPYGTAAA